MAHSKPLEFLAKAQEDPKIADRVFAAVEKGGMVTAEEVLRIASEAGFSFTREEFERDVRKNLEERFAAGDQSLATMLKTKGPPQSSCAKGCLSYTVSWHLPKA